MVIACLTVKSDKLVFPKKIDDKMTKCFNYSCMMMKIKYEKKHILARKTSTRG